MSTSHASALMPAASNQSTGTWWPFWGTGLSWFHYKVPAVDQGQVALNVALPCHVHPVCTAPVFPPDLYMYVCICERGQKNLLKMGFGSQTSLPYSLAKACFEYELAMIILVYRPWDPKDIHWTGHSISPSLLLVLGSVGEQVILSDLLVPITLMNWNWHFQYTYQRHGVIGLKHDPSLSCWLTIVSGTYIPTHVSLLSQHCKVCLCIDLRIGCFPHWPTYLTTTQ